MTHTQQKRSEACDLATHVANRYGRLALTRAAGEAAAAERRGDHETKALWTSVIAYLRESIQTQHALVTA